MNAKSGLYKVQLSEKELETLDMNEITVLAGNVRPMFRTDRTGLIPRYAVKPIRSAIDFYEKSGAKVLPDWRVAQMDERGIDNFLKSISSQV